MSGFQKNSCNKEIEGYLSTKKDFNGALIILRESNDGGGEKSCFWFKKVMNPIMHSEMKGREKSTGTRYKNYLEKVLCKYASKRELKNAAYCNILNIVEERDTITSNNEAYKKLSPEDKAEIAQSKIKECNAKYVFTCDDVFMALVKEFAIEDYENKGIQYKKVRKGMFSHKGIEYYEILHPSYPQNGLKD